MICGGFFCFFFPSCITEQKDNKDLLYWVAQYEEWLQLWMDAYVVSMFTVFLRLHSDGFQVFIQTLFEQIVFNIQLLFTGYVHRIYTQVWTQTRKKENASSGAASSAFLSESSGAADIQAQGMWGKMTSMLIFSLSPRDVST